MGKRSALNARVSTRYGHGATRGGQPPQAGRDSARSDAATTVATCQPSLKTVAPSDSHAQPFCFTPLAKGG
jgi:hypothetical protein